MIYLCPSVGGSPQHLGPLLGRESTRCAYIPEYTQAALCMGGGRCFAAHILPHNVHMTYVLRCAKMWICAILHVNESVCAMFKFDVSKHLTSSI